MERFHPEMTTYVRKNPKIAISAVAAITTRQRVSPELGDAHAHVALRRCKPAGSVHYSAVRLPPALVAAGALWWPLLCHAQGVSPTPQPQGTPAQPEEITTEAYGYHFQSTGTEQFQPAFPSRFQGPQSLSSAANGRETFDATAYLGIRPWDGAEIWFNPEIDQGFGLGNTFGVAGYPSGEAYKVGQRDPYFLIQRLFLRQTINLGGGLEKVDPDLNQLGGSQTANRLVISAGKLSVVDIFDTNKYAHDPRNDFLNWSVIDAGAFDYAADAWGYSYGAAVELYYDRFAVRLGAFDLSSVPNGKNVSPTVFGQVQFLGEIEENHSLWNQPGKLKVLYWIDSGKLGLYDNAVALGLATGTVPSTAAVRSYHTKGGIVLNLEQQISPNLGMFARFSLSQGNVEEDAFTDINQSIQVGLSASGDRWQRPHDTAGAAFVVNEISHAGKLYLEAGGLGGIVGDGALPAAGPEQIFETFYSVALYQDIAHITFDYQLINHPAYDAARGPVSVLGARLHAQF
jgi:high affinity Mn2+ porin